MNAYTRILFICSKGKQILTESLNLPPIERAEIVEELLSGFEFPSRKTIDDDLVASDTISENPNIYPLVFRQIHPAFVYRFPFAMFTQKTQRSQKANVSIACSTAAGCLSGIGLTAAL